MGLKSSVWGGGGLVVLWSIVGCGVGETVSRKVRALVGDKPVERCGLN